MSGFDVRRVIARSMLDEAFLSRFFGDPDRALGEYRLTPEELEALKSGEQDRIYAAARWTLPPWWPGENG